MTNVKRPEEARGIDHNRLPTGIVVGDPIKGDFMALALFGWVSLRDDKTKTPLVILTLLLLSGEGDEMKPAGTLKMELPIFPETEDPTVDILEKLGWDGRVWPNDDGWPSGTVEEEALVGLMDSASLRATMTFPPRPEGASAMPVSVQRARGPFLMPPLPAPEGEVDATLKAKLQALCENPRVFYRPTKPAIFIQ